VTPFQAGLGAIRKILTADHQIGLNEAMDFDWTGGPADAVPVFDDSS